MFFQKKLKNVHTRELLHGAAYFTHAHVRMSRHSEGVELAATQVQEGTAAFSGFAGGVNT